MLVYRFSIHSHSFKDKSPYFLRPSVGFLAVCYVVLCTCSLFCGTSALQTLLPLHNNRIAKFVFYFHIIDILKFGCFILEAGARPAVTWRGHHGRGGAVWLELGGLARLVAVRAVSIIVLAVLIHPQPDPSGPAPAPAADNHAGRWPPPWPPS